MADPSTGAAPVAAAATENPTATPDLSPGSLLADAADAAGKTPADPASPVATDPQPAADATPEADAPKVDDKPAPRAPEAYEDFTFSDGLTFEDATLADYKTLAKELDLSQEAAQKLLEFGGTKLKTMVEAPYKAWSDMQQQWQAEIKADPEIGGAHLESSIKAASEVFRPGPGNPFVKNEADATALKQALNTTGAGNNPAIVKMFVNLGKLMQEPGTVNGNPIRQSPKGLGELFYPNMPKTTQGA